MAPAVSNGVGGKSGKGILTLTYSLAYGWWRLIDLTAKLDEVTSLLDSLRLDLKDKSLKAARKYMFPVSVEQVPR
jgi:hypothetical protein